MPPLASRRTTVMRGSAAAASSSAASTKVDGEQSSTSTSCQSVKVCSVTERIVLRSTSTGGSYTGVTTEKRGDIQPFRSRSLRRGRPAAWARRQELDSSTSFRRASRLP
jgi:hypothetical protein